MAEIFDTLINDGRFVTLVDAINRASLMQGLMEPTSVTIFAPTDEAFSKLPSGLVGTLLDNPPELTTLLTYHVIADRITSNDISSLNSVKTVEGSDLKIDTSNGVRINDANVVTADIEADNGIIHVIDNVLIPQSLDQFLKQGSQS
ncbi:fasciclin domain-containing protein [Aerosakkonemataceae cyanobacterium BLCC-F50]|uniref:Fasciclin domain-containing protein n=1 Tax=Floridaenema flaviceps BLCC-F50 TaxID=3153642 RepID=A0ABV4XVA9_9CYAN